MITVWAPDGIGEITSDSDLIGEIVAATNAHPTAAEGLGPLIDGDIVIVTSKIISKLEGRTKPAEERDRWLRHETVRTVARKVRATIVAGHRGLVQAAAGIDASNVAAGTVLLLPVDPDASAERLRRGIADRLGVTVGVIISDTAGRTWRLGQTDHAIGCAGVAPMIDYAHRHDAYGNELRVTLTAIADEIAAAADLVKGKLAARPVAVLRGRGDLVVDGPSSATELIRPIDEDLFRLGSREAVLMAVLELASATQRYEELVWYDDPAAVINEIGLDGEVADAALTMLATAYAWAL